MKYWKTPSGRCYIGDRLHYCDIEVTERPPLTKEQEAEVAKEELLEIDKESIRPLRSIIIAILTNITPSKEDVEVLIFKEIEAKEKRSKL